MREVRATSLSFDFEDVGKRFVPAGEPAVAGPEGWHPNDELFVPLEHSDGRIVGNTGPRRRKTLID